MLRFLRAWAWVRWRTRVNAIEHSDRADRIQRFTRATEVLGPIMVAVMMVPAAIMAVVAGLATGYGMGSGAEWGEVAMHVCRGALVIVSLLTIIGPLLLPSGRGLASLPRLLLLPVPHRALYAGELVGGLAEPWIVMAALAAIALPVGAAAAGNLALAAGGIVAGAILLLTLSGLGAFFSALMHVLMGDRRRGEWIVVAVLTLLPLIAMLPSFLMTDGTRQDRRTRDAKVEAQLEEVLERPAGGALALLPSELYVASLARVSGQSSGSPVLPMGGLVIAAGVAVAAGWSVWKRTIVRGGISTGRARARAGKGRRAGWMRTATSGIAFTFVQHVLRTARGRAIVLPAIVMSLVFAGLVATRGGMDFGALSLQHGFAVALFGVVMAFLSPVQLWMNQFAIDKAGLTMLCVQPLTSGQILRGKMAGAGALIGTIAAIPMTAGLLIGAPLSPVYWVVLVLGAVAAFVALAPFAALLSTFFPKHVDLTSIGQRSNAHPVAGLLGGVLILAAGAPPAGAALVGFRMLHSPAAALGLSVAWLGVAVLLHWPLWKIAVRAFDRRREALVMVANGR